MVRDNGKGASSIYAKSKTIFNEMYRVNRKIMSDRQCSDTLDKINAEADRL
jgi:hypothetical protein